MNKKLIVFSLIFVLFFSFPLSCFAHVRAGWVVPPTVNVSDNIITHGIEYIVDVANSVLATQGVVISEKSELQLLRDTASVFFGRDFKLILDDIPSNDYSGTVNTINNYMVSQNSIDYDALTESMVNNFVDFSNQKDYYIESTFHFSEGASILKSYPGTSNQSAIASDFAHMSSLSLPVDNSLYFVTTMNTTTNNGYGDGYEFTNTGRYLYLIPFDLDFFNESFFYFTNLVDPPSGLLDNKYLLSDRGIVNNSNPSLPLFKFFIASQSGTNYESVSVNCYRYSFNFSSFALYNSINNVKSFSFLPLIRYGMSSSRPNFFKGGFFIVPDSVDNFSFPVFKDFLSGANYYLGKSDIYTFDSNFDIPIGADIDYRRLYDVISDSVVNANGNVTEAINRVANDFLQQQLDLLHDINNALNDGNGQSWLRRIYGILDYNFPLTLHAFDELQQAIQNISISGGGSDLTHINRVLDEINDKLGFMIEEPLTNADIEDMNDLKNLAQQKFPFCVFSDIVAISVILNQTPEQPHWQIPLKLPGSESVNNIEVDLSWYENTLYKVTNVFIPGQVNLNIINRFRARQFQRNLPMWLFRSLIQNY